MRKIFSWYLLGGLLATPVWADISFSGSPSAGMGGAGLAVIRRPTALAFQNPAMAAYIARPSGAGSVDFSSRGAGVQSLLDDLNIGQGSAADIGTTATLLRTYARQDTQLQITGDLGVIANGVVVSVGGIVDARLLPNEPLRIWARTDGNPNNIPANARADLIAISAISLPDVAAAIRLPAEQGDLAMGVRLRNLKFYYTHYVADKARLQEGGSATRAPELQGRDYIERSALGVDLGFLWQPTADKTYTLALVVENFVEPNIRFQATNRDGQVFNFKPLKRTYNAAVAFDLETGSLIAIDFIDVGNNAGKGEIRLGYEQRLARGFALRAGYASKTGWTAGLGIGGFNVAYSDRLPVVVSRTLNF